MKYNYTYRLLVLLVAICSATSSYATIGYPEVENSPFDQTIPGERYMFTDGENHFANAYVKLSDDGVFDKPFIFVEGIDFEPPYYDVGPYNTEYDQDSVNVTRYGKFGWKAFIGEDQEDYAYLSYMGGFLDSLLQNGYDLILLDFMDGADYIQNNASLLRTLINRTNEEKIGDAQLVVAGASMGGQVARVALREMELAGEDHCTRLYISLDSPHKGAVVPLGLQHAINFLASGGSPAQAEAQQFIDGSLLRPATVQMLVQLYEPDYSLYDEFQSYLNEIGFPQNCRNISVANGNIVGEGLDLPNDRFIDHNCDVDGLENAFTMRIWPTPGPVCHVAFTDGDGFAVEGIEAVFDNFEYNVTVGDYNDYDYNETSINLPLYDADFYTTTIFTDQGYRNYDVAPGGYRNSIKVLVDKINSKLPSAGLPDDCDTLIHDYEYYPNHTFVPTASALGIDLSNLNHNLSDLIAADPDIHPFDDVYAPVGDNQPHSFVEPTNIDFILHNVLNGIPDLEDGLSVASANSGVYNLADPLHTSIGSVGIYEGGILYFNSSLPIGYGADYAYVSEEFQSAPVAHQEIYTSDCGSAIIQASGLGTIILGDADNGTTTDLTVRAGDMVRLNEGGQLIIESGSTLTIEDGARLVINHGVLRIEDGGTLVIKEGGVLRYWGNNPIQLKGSDALIKMNGVIQIGPNSHLSFSHYGTEPGEIHFESYLSDENVIGTSTSKLTIAGDNPSDVIIRLSENAQIWSYGLNEMNINKGTVVMNEDARIVAFNYDSYRVNYLFEPVNPDCTANCENRGLDLWGKSTFNDCLFEKTPITYRYANDVLEINSSDFYNENSIVTVLEGGYIIGNTSFTDAGVFGHVTTTIDSKISASNFTNSYVHDSGDRTLEVRSSFFDQSHLRKNYGLLGLACSNFENTMLGVEVEQGILDISSNNRYGGNRFNHNVHHIFLYNAEEIRMKNGRNHFDEEVTYVSGTLQGDCSTATDCYFTIDASQNYWKREDQNSTECGPDQEKVALFIEDSTDDGCDQSGSLSDGCQIELYDPIPLCEWETCRSGVIAVIKPLKDKSQQAVLQSHENFISLYPNPNDGNFQIRIDRYNAMDKYTYSLYDVRGALTHSGNINSENEFLSFDDLSTGLYTIIVSSQGQQQVERVMIE